MKEDLQKLYFTSKEVTEYSGLVVDIDKPIIKPTVEEKKIKSQKIPKQKNKIVKPQQKQGCLIKILFGILRFILGIFIFIFLEALILGGIVEGLFEVNVEAVYSSDFNAIAILIFSTIFVFIGKKSQTIESEEDTIVSINNSNTNVVTESLEKFFILIGGIQEYNKRLKAIDIADQLAEANNQQALSGDDRKKIIAVYSSLKKDFIKKLKTEKIIRENKQFLDSMNNDDLLENSVLSNEILAIEAETGELSNGITEAIKFSTELEKQVNQMLRKNI